jgi:O-antigen/teichoic acid export membrane protein
MAYLQTRQRSVTFIVFSSMNLAMKLSLNILFVIYWNMGVLGVLYSAMISFFVLGAGMTYRTFSMVGFRFSREKFMNLVTFGYPFVLSGLCAFITTYSDRLFLNYYTDLSSVGIYSLGYKFGFMLMMFPVMPFLNIWNVQRFEFVGKDGYDDLVNRFLIWFVIVTLTVALVISLILRDVLKVMSAPAFWDAHKIVPVILLAYFFQACTDYFNFGIYHTGRTKHIAYGTFLAAVVVIALNFLLIPVYGIYGAAWATLISFVVRMIYYYAASQRLYRIDYKLTKPAAVLVLAIAIQLLYLGGREWIPALNEAYISHSFILLMIGLFVFLLFSTKIITAEERTEIFHFVRSPSKMISQFKI